MTTEIADDIELVPVEDLIPYSNNPKEHPDEQVKKIASSIKNYGWDQPIVIDGENEIIKGHGRYRAAQLLDLERVPAIRRTDLSKAETKAARIADNKTNLDTGFDYDLLATEVDVLLDDYDDDELSDLLAFDDDGIDDLIEREGGSVDDFMDADPYDFDSTEDNETDDTDDDSDTDDTTTQTLYDEDGNEVNIETTQQEGETKRITRTVECPECGNTFDT